MADEPKTDGAMAKEFAISPVNPEAKGKYVVMVNLNYPFEDDEDIIESHLERDPFPDVVWISGDGAEPEEVGIYAWTGSDIPWDVSATARFAAELKDGGAVMFEGDRADWHLDNMIGYGAADALVASSPGENEWIVDVSLSTRVREKIAKLRSALPFIEEWERRMNLRD